ncbi:MAG: UMP kinase [Candidatus Woesearchaeota archaeon]
METIVLSLGGSIIVPDKPDYFFLREFKNFILTNLNRYSFIIVCGGGKTNFYYNEAAKRISDVSKNDLDLIGIMATKLNAELVRSIFGGYAYPKIITSPNSIVFKNFYKDNFKKNNKTKVFVASGWKPGNSSDYVSVLIAKNLRCKRIFNLTNVDYVYDKDPRMNKDAKKIVSISWNDFRKMFSSEWQPRMNSPFDPIASKEAQKHKLKVFILKGTDLKNLQNAFENKDFVGTTIY